MSNSNRFHCKYSYKKKLLYSPILLRVSFGSRLHDEPSRVLLFHVMILSFRWINHSTRSMHTFKANIPFFFFTAALFTYICAKAPAHHPSYVWSQFWGVGQRTCTHFIVFSICFRWKRTTSKDYIDQNNILHTQLMASSMCRAPQDSDQRQAWLHINYCRMPRY